jgi:hypothetical protein
VRRVVPAGSRLLANYYFANGRSALTKSSYSGSLRSGSSTMLSVRLRCNPSQASGMKLSSYGGRSHPNRLRLTRSPERHE